MTISDTIKKPQEEIEFTPEMIQELVKCEEDFFYFCQYVQIKHPDLGRVPFNPRWYQREFLDIILNNKKFCGLLARQVGKTISVSVYILWYAIFNSEKTIGIVSNKQDTAVKILSEIKKMYELLPNHLKPGVNIYNRTSIEFENNTIILANATTEDPFRSYTLNILFADELAFVRPSIAESFWASNYPTLSASKESKVIVISTPNGLWNLFERLYTGAVNGQNGFSHYTADWRVIEGRDEDWKQEQIGVLGEQQFLQEHEVQFLGSTNTIIDSELLSYLMNETENIDPIKTDLNGSFRIYQKPQQGCIYILGIDVAKGTGEHFSTIQVLRIDSINPVKMEQVAVFEDNKTDPYRFAEIAYRISNYYNSAYIMCENNAEGSTVVSQLWWEFEAEQLVNTGSKIADLGVRASKNTKPKAVNLMKKFIEDRLLKLNDEETVKQLTDFTDLGNNKFKCVNLDDDLVSALYWSTYIFEMNILDEDISFKKQEEDEEDMWGILSDYGDGVEDIDWSWVTN